MRKLSIIIAVIWSMVAQQSAAISYRTSLLERMAKAANIIVTDSLFTNTELDSVATIRGKVVHLRTDSWGQVTHIGYNMFNRAFTAQYDNRFILEFIERYLLEMDLGLDERGAEKRMDVDQVTIVSGSLDVLRKVTPQTSLSFNLEVIKRKIYRLTWDIGEKKVCITIPADCQLIMGANSIELEEVFKRDVLSMMSITSEDIIQDWYSLPVTRAGDILIVNGGIYMSDMIRGSLYLTDKKGHRKLICSPERPSRSVSNIMLTGIFDRELPMNLAISLYGNKTDHLPITLQQFVSYCKQEHCKLYFGIKTKSDKSLTGTLFAYNESLAYTHMLSVDFPLSLLKEGNESIQATAYVYIPLRHIADKFFIQEFNPTLFYDEE
ncbi:MAG: hypothetical protein J1E57_04200 [Prevotella sp.]|nr:hypothetical protein [Prevotella sp.]